MAARMAKLGAKGVVVDGRVRDLDTLRGLEIPIWTKGTSIVGAAGETKAWAVNVAVQIGHVLVEPGDLVFIDPAESGVVVIPRTAIAKVLEMLPKLVEADENVMAAVLSGGEVGEAFRKFRG
jgi:regulator of RNase E activity RraA